MRNFLIVGGSRGIGNSLGAVLPEQGDTVWIVSRTQPQCMNRPDGVTRHWIQGDVTDLALAKKLDAEIGRQKLDVLIYNAGIWEESPFGQLTPERIARIVTVNLTAMLVIVQALMVQLKGAPKANVILVGSTSGLPHRHSSAVVYDASKNGMRGAAHTLREIFRGTNVGVTYFAPGAVAAEVHVEDGPQAALTKHQGRRMPVQDVVDVLRCILSLSPAALVKEVIMPALNDKDI
ncbi:MAG: SDR family NAD(P)-dependent oxidoreductase [Proteobacteria bacterium]|nr:SDR family NAD(P)-dependent oxidoreductase [Pseudomonadota bacterium]